MNKTDILLSSINTFYTEPQNKTTLMELLNKNGGISLRNLEWFITNYSKKNNLAYTSSDGKTFNVHCAYKSSLDGYSKKLFDPFCRSEKINYVVPGTDVELHTTVAQLNFIKWCIKNNIVEYIRKNHDALFSKQAT
jgi:hypothetical protein